MSATTIQSRLREIADALNDGYHCDLGPEDAALFTALAAQTPPEPQACRREFPERGHERCGKPATHILWGKLLPKEALGPRCEDCVIDQVGDRALRDPSWAIYKLPVLHTLCKACGKPVHSTLTDQCPHCGESDYGQ